MNKQHAIDLVRTTFESPFSRERFASFIGRLLNQLEIDPIPLRTGQMIPDAFRVYVSKYERLGKYTDGDGNRVDVLIVYLRHQPSVERARATQRRFIAGYLQGKYGSNADKDAALVAFVSAENPDDWRFSLVKLETHLEATAKGKLKAVDDFTPARRWSFLVGAHEKSHTAQTRLVPIMQETERNPTLAQLEEAFNIEKVTKEFFEKYRDLFIRTKAELDKAVAANPKTQADLTAKGVDTVNLAKKLLGQIIFLYYLQKKGWFGVPRDGEWGDGSKQFLRELFNGNHGAYTNFFNDILEHLFYDALRHDRSHDDHYYGRFNCRIPFLNGGLFDPMGNYDWVRADILLPNDLFSNQHKTKEGDTGDGILDIFDRYNFTVREDEPLEKEVAIDPELLGKAYEKFNAIRPDNYAEFVAALTSGKKGEESQFNKQYGVYYTPREIVHYMCRQSLIHYLTTAVSQSISQDDITQLIEQGENWRENDARVVKEGRETDSYPFRAPAAIRENAALLDDKLAAVTVCDPAVGSGAFPVGMMGEIVRARQTLSTYLPAQDGRSPYVFKRAAIEHTLYGVDIDPGAVEIAKLRLWLSLIVEEEDIRQIKPLPNLDYKIVCGNSLIGFPDSYQTGIGQEIERLIRDHFHETHPTRKEQLKRQIDEKINGRYAASRKALGYRVDFDFRTVFAEVFQQNGGFDVVIGNPPYISHDKIPIGKAILKQMYQSYEPFADIFCYFIERGMKLQNDMGFLTFITSNSYLRTEYGFPLRRLIRKENEIVSIINVEDAQIFEDAIVNVAILISTKHFNNRDAFVFNQPFSESISLFQQYIANRGYYFNQKIFDTKSWNLIEPEKALLQQKIERGKKTLDQLGAKIRLGLATGNNNAFVIDRSKRDEFVRSNGKNAEIIKPILRGRDIFRYRYEFADLYILLTKNGINVQQDYPDIYHYLDGFGQSFKERGAKGQHWTNLRAVAFFDDFKKKKIIWIELSDTGRFALCEDEMYLLNSAYFLLPPPTVNIKFLLGILNSRLIHFYLGLIAETSGMGTTRWINNYVKEFPIANPISEQQETIISLVNQILAAKQANPQADVSAWEAEIDRHVYALYGLTPAEIALVEGRPETSEVLKTSEV